MLAAIALIAGCARPAAQDVKPIVAVVTPLDGARYEPGEVINLTIAAASSQNVARVELSLNGSIVATQVNPAPSPTFSTRISYVPPVRGRIELQVVAVDTAGASSQPDVLALQVGDPMPVAAPPPAAAPDDGAANGAGNGVVGPNGCALQATFLQDVNVPDGAQIDAGAAFNKTWRMQNTSSCDWGEGYVLAFEADTPLSAAGVVPVPPTPSNGVFDVTVELTAPAQPGTYTSTWRIKDPAGQAFGNRVFVVIRVP
jgi:hypothetical protein